MRPNRIRPGTPSLLLVCVAVLSLLPAAVARAGHHRWDFTEVFTSEDGSVQFVELIGTANNEQNLLNFTITTTSGGSFTFNANTPDTLTNGKWVLVATDAFAMAEGAPAPDYVLPEDFFDPTGDTLNYAGGADTWAISGVPTDGVNSLDRTSGTGPNTPTNYAGESGSIDLTPAPMPSTLPAIGRWGIVLLVGLLVLVASGLRGRRQAAWE